MKNQLRSRLIMRGRDITNKKWRKEGMLLSGETVNFWPTERREDKKRKSIARCMEARHKAEAWTVDQMCCLLERGQGKPHILAVLPYTRG